MKKITFITGNQDKADYLAKWLGYPIYHKKLELEELQSLNLAIVVQHKAEQAFKILNKPVLVEDVSLEFCALGRLPGTFIKWFEQELTHNQLCRLLDFTNDRSAIARCMFGYFDGQHTKLIEGSLEGNISESPRGKNGFGWDPIFIPQGYSMTRAEMDIGDNQATYQTIKPFKELKKFLETI